MRRLHLFELTDERWCPAFLRDMLTDYLEAVVAAGNPYAAIIERLRRALEQTGERRVIDLCSGAGGPWQKIKPQLDAELPAPTIICLTDLFPHEDTAAAPGLVRYPRSVDARNVPPELQGFRTLFAGFHHFRPNDARAILADAARQRQGIGVFELTQRSPKSIALICITPIFVLLLTPFMKPFRWSRLFWTYVIPLVPFGVVFDGIVSCLRTYTTDELRAMTATIDAPGYTWEIGEESARPSPIPITYLIGYPR